MSRSCRHLSTSCLEHTSCKRCQTGVTIGTRVGAGKGWQAHCLAFDRGAGHDFFAASSPSLPSARLQMQRASPGGTDWSTWQTPSVRAQGAMQGRPGAPLAAQGETQSHYGHMRSSSSLTSSWPGFSGPLAMPQHQALVRHQCAACLALRRTHGPRRKQIGLRRGVT
jgi:hypothetical protein